MLGTNRVEITFSGHPGLSQTKLGMTSQLFISNFTTVLDDFVGLSYTA
jgi:hypothetical protein